MKIDVIVADNGSVDNSVDIAKSKGAHVVNVPFRGYGAALDAGIRQASTEYIVIGDSDLSYDFKHAKVFCDLLVKSNADLVIGNRFKGTIFPGAMPALHKYFGNPVLSYIARTFFGIKVGDFHCGLRAFRKSAYLEANPASKGMEFATEMVIRFSQGNMKIIESPTTLKPDGRNRKPHLRSFPDGWRHLKLMMLFAPQFTLLFPGLILNFLGSFFLVQFYFKSKINFLNVNGDVSAGLLCSLVGLFGIQLFVAGATQIAYAKVRGVGRFRWVPPIFSKKRQFFSIAVPSLLIIIGTILIMKHIIFWITAASPHLDPIFTSSKLIPAVTLWLYGSQLLIGAFQVRQIISKSWR